ncbi:MAG: hypothetical protein O3B24_05120 [Verrucomicrobia bacterium]|nr:hypothetical protein [Verrucomicrobiota bacterium]
MSTTNLSVGRWGWRLLPVIIWALVCSVPDGVLAQGAPGRIVKINKQELTGNITWLASQRGYEVAAGSTRTSVSLNQVASIQVAPPAELVRAIQSGDTATLSRIVDSYRMLGPDLDAMRALAEGLRRAGKGQEALDRFKKVMEHRAPETVPAEVSRVYWNILLDAERYDDLRNQLTAAIEKGPRPQVATAQLLRGEMDMRRKQYREALVNGYLRTIVLFANVKAVQPEALLKAALCFDELGESQNAEKMRRKLAQEYPGSPQR